MYIYLPRNQSVRGLPTPPQHFIHFLPQFANLFCWFAVFIYAFPGSSVMLHRRISAELSKRLKRPWTPSFCKKDSISWSGTKPQAWHKEVQSFLLTDFSYCPNSSLDPIHVNKVIRRFGIINWVYNINWPPLRVSKLTFWALALCH